MTNSFSWLKSVAIGSLAIGMGVGLSGCSGVGGTTYGTGVSQEMALLNDVNGMFGSSEKKEPIDYSSRPGLVLPPKGTALPSPQDDRELAASTAENWPTDPDALRRLYHEKLSSMSERERASLLAAIRRLPRAQRDAILKNDPRAVDFANQIEEPDLSKGPPTDTQSRVYAAKVRERMALIKAANGEEDGTYKRKYLTQPPEDYRKLTPELEAEMARIATEDPEKKKTKKKWWPF